MVQTQTMITLNFNFPSKNLKGEEQKGTLGELLADLLASETKGNAVKFYDWAVRLSNAKEIVVDKADLKTIEDLINSTERVMILGKAQLLMIIENSRAAKPKKVEDNDEVSKDYSEADVK